MDADLLLFFDRMPYALPLYEALLRRMQAEIGEIQIKVQKTQISFYRRRMFGCVSFARVRRRADCPQRWFTLTFGLDRRVDSPRIEAAAEPYPNRWTHHVLLTCLDDLDETVMGWVEEAYQIGRASCRERV